MAVTIKPIGDDQKWKKQMQDELNKAIQDIALLKKQLQQLRSKVK